MLANIDESISRHRTNDLVNRRAELDIVGIEGFRQSLGKYHTLCRQCDGGPGHFRFMTFCGRGFSALARRFGLAV